MNVQKTKKKKQKNRLNTLKNTKDIHSIIHWVGGKKRLVDKILENIPKKFNDYYEPFLGGAIVFLNMKYSKKAILNDYNKDLINLYRFIKKEPNELLKLVCKYENSYNLSNDKKRHFLEKRKRFNDLLGNYNLERIALYIYLNKTCFNGIVQTNRYGKNTSAFGNHKKINICTKDNFYKFSSILKGVELYNKDYRDVLKNAKKNDFIYLDPPYVEDDIKQYTFKYTKDGWNINDFDELVKTYKELDKKGCKVMLSNSDSKYIRKNFSKNDYRVLKLPIHRVLARGKEHRGIQYELLIMNY